MLREYIENLTPIVSGVPPSNIWNYDESNLTDDPGRKRVIAKRGCKYPERICNSSKTSISIMMSGSAAGDLLPPYVVYRSTKLWHTWAENGPSGARYGNSVSGWFDACSFTDWFQSLILPKLKKLEGKKVVIGDNLSSHLTPDVLSLCEKNDISFVCLPPNSMHLTQPLDVAFFGPMKREWRKILSEWREKKGHSSGNLDKAEFPGLLKLLIANLESTAKDNLVSGFRKCGIHPLSVSELLTRLPNTKTDAEGLIEDTFLKSLEERRKQWTEAGTKRRRKAVNVPAGTSITAEDLQAPSTSGEAEKRKSTPGTDLNNLKKKKKRVMSGKANEEDDDVDLLKELEEYEEDKRRDELLIDLAEGKTNVNELLNLNPVKKQVGEFILFSYEGEVFPGEIVNFTDQEATISSMQKSLKSWKWPNQKDVHNYPWEDVMGGIKPPKQISKRGFFDIPELKCIWN